MIKEILSYQQESSSLEPSSEERALLLEAVAEYANEFLDNLHKLPAYNADNTGIAKLKEKKITDTSDIQSILELLNLSVDTIGINPASGGHLGYIPGGGIYTSALGDYLAAVLNKYAGLHFAAPGAVILENKIIKWVCDLLGFPSGALGNITSGGSIANMIAICTARDKMNISQDISNAVIYYSQQTHHCVNKAAKIAGLAACVYRQIPLDSEYRMDYTCLKRQIEEDLSTGLKPFFIASSCGSTDTGAVDEFSKIASIAKEHNVWFHVDAAYGGFFAMSSAAKSLFEGIQEADSVVLDPHKSLFLPYGAGIIIVKEGEQLFDSFHYMANYLQDAYADGAEVSPADLSPELTKHFRGLRIWIPLQLHGMNSFSAALDEKLLLTKYLYQKLKEIGFEVGPMPHLSVCIYRYTKDISDPNEFNQKLITAIQNDGRIFISSTTIEDVFWIRAAIVSFRTHLDTIDLFINLLQQKIHQLSK